MRFILVRHVETIANANKQYIGWKESEITEDGKKQILNLRKNFKDENVDYIYSSPLRRTLTVAEVISEILNKKIIIEDDLKEMNFGIFEGKDYKQVIKDHELEWNQWTKDYKNYEIPQGESVDLVYKRVTKFIDKIKNKDESILIVTHGGIIHTIITYLLDLSIDDRWHFKITPGTIVEIEYKDNYGILTKIIPNQ